MDNKVDSLIEEGRKIESQLAHIVSDDYQRNSLKHILILGYYNVIFEHHTSIILLIKNKKYVSAFAFVRIFFEPFCRAFWLANCATDEVVEKIRDKKHNFPKSKDMMDDLDKTLDMGGQWQNFKKNMASNE